MSQHWSFDNPLMPPGEPVPGKTYRADGWQYVDLPTRLSPDMKVEFFAVLGEGNWVILAETHGPDYWRGQLLISPEGQERMKARIRVEEKVH